MGRLVMIAAGLSAFVLNMHLLRSGEDTTMVAVAGTGIGAGTIVSADMLRFVEVDASEPVVARLVTDPGAVEGLIASVDIAAGDPISLSLLRDAAATGGMRAFTIEVDPSHAGGGRLIRPGDVVDVIAVEGKEARYVVTGAPVLDVADMDGGGLVAASDYYLVVAVDADTALQLAAALQAESVEVVRATGARAPDRLATAELGAGDAS